MGGSPGPVNLEEHGPEFGVGPDVVERNGVHGLKEGVHRRLGPVDDALPARAGGGGGRGQRGLLRKGGVRSFP